MVKWPTASHSRPGERVPLEELIVREYAAAFVVLGLLLALATLRVVPVGTAAGGMAPEHVRAPWIFGGIQQLLFFLLPWVAGLFFPLATFLCFLTFPKWSKKSGERSARWILLVLMGIWALLTAYYVLNGR